jgi:hypothetical protein
MSKFIGFLFNPVTINERLKPKWVTIMDHEYLKSILIEPILNNIHLSESLLQELIGLTEHGQQIVSQCAKKPTKCEPFVARPYNEKKVAVIKKEELLKTKATLIPKGLFENNKCKDILDEIKKGLDKIIK